MRNCSASRDGEADATAVLRANRQQPWTGRTGNRSKRGPSDTRPGCNGNADGAAPLPLPRDPRSDAQLVPSILPALIEIPACASLHLNKVHRDPGTSLSPGPITADYVRSSPNASCTHSVLSRSSVFARFHSSRQARKTQCSKTSRTTTYV